MSYLVLTGLQKAYGLAQVVQDLNITVVKGEFLSLLGPSGCGKTTTLQMIAGFVEPTSGAIRLDGVDLLHLPPSRRGLGIVFQSYALFPHMTVSRNVAFGLEMRKIPRGEVRKRVSEALALVGLADKGERFPRQMSGGQQQRVALARALVIRPSILLLDEPLSNLDAKMREEMQIELRQIQRELGTTTILVTHDQQEALALSDRIVVMNAGRVEQVGTPLDVYERPATPFVASFLGTTNVFRGEGHGMQVCFAGHHVSVARPVAGLVEFTVRPEKLLLLQSGAGGLPGTVLTRVFQGGHWLFQVETSAGRTVVIRQNDGTAVPGEGEAVVLGFDAAHAQIRTGEATL